MQAQTASFGVGESRPLGEPSSKASSANAAANNARSRDRQRARRLGLLSKSTTSSSDTPKPKRGLDLSDFGI
ncbi:hypothetical protein PYCC9005_005135 [Savitreella phatthalungensis]